MNTKETDIEYLMDKRITSLIPDWVKIGARVRIKINPNSRGTILGVQLQPLLIHVRFENNAFVSFYEYSGLEPIPLWQPQKGDTVAIICGLSKHAVDIRDYEPVTDHTAREVYRVIGNEEWMEAGCPLDAKWWRERKEYREEC